MNFPTTFVAMPMRDEAELALKVIDLLRHEAGDLSLLVLDNGSAAENKQRVRDAIGADWPGEASVHDMAGLTIYQMWNAAWEAASIVAKEFGHEVYEVAFLNTDIDFLPNTMTAMAHLLRREGLGAVCPNYNRPLSDGAGAWPEMGVSSGLRHVTGSYRAGGLCGWCFMVRGELEVRVDERFEWWCGDDDLFLEIEKAGLPLGIIEGLPLEHVGEATASHYPELHAAKARDMERLREKWGARAG